MEVRATEEGESECRSVIERISGCVSIAGHITGLRKQGRLPFGLSHEKT